MKLNLICPNCGKNDWKETELAGEPIYQCNSCKELAQPEEMIAEEEKPTYYILEKYIPSEKAWFFEACYNTAYPSDLNSLAFACYHLGRHKTCGEHGQCVRIISTDTPPDDPFSPSGYPKTK